MDYIVHGVAESWTRLTDFDFDFNDLSMIYTLWADCMYKIIFKHSVAHFHLCKIWGQKYRGLGESIWVSPRRAVNLQSSERLQMIKIGAQMVFYKIIRSWENSTETCILSSVKQIASPGWMHETSARGWCTRMTQRDGMEREAGGGNRDGEHM